MQERKEVGILEIKEHYDWLKARRNQVPYPKKHPLNSLRGTLTRQRNKSFPSKNDSWPCSHTATTYAIREGKGRHHSVFNSHSLISTMPAEPRLCLGVRQASTAQGSERCPLLGPRGWAYDWSKLIPLGAFRVGTGLRISAKVAGRGERASILTGRFCYVGDTAKSRGAWIQTKESASRVLITLWS